ncbi:MAG: site-2 protease family protein [Synergistaceae bacterium]|nr:site-2 protease family protein [Synergistaceae bacterium]
MPRLAELVLSIPAVLWAITFHEFCHGYAAYRLGDPTAMQSGRLTLNPLAHLDPLGALMLLIARFGWARPVPIDPRYFRNPARDMVLVSLAGAAGNLATAFGVGLLMRILPNWVLMNAAALNFLVLMVFINLGLAVFNLLPIPPLDGSKILYVFLPPRWMKGFYFLEQYGMLILMILVIFGTVQRVMSPIVLFIASLALPGWFPL